MTLQQKEAVDVLAGEIEGMIIQARGREFYRAIAAGGIAVGAAMIGLATLACEMGWMCVYWPVG